MSKNNEWLNKKTPRSVDQLRLWPDNPRLNPEETHIQISDFAEDFTSEDSDKKQFFKLIKSITEDGFIPADPVVVWKNLENEKYYVAEGNRRVLALKLLREPHKAPKGIRAFIRTQSAKIDLSSIEKILVNVAPTFEEAEWYINQRNSTSSLQQSWSRVQQQRWISELYDKYNGDIIKIMSITKMSKSDLEGFIRILKIKDLVKQNEVKNKLTEEEYENAISYKFPISILERFFSNKDAKEKWGLDFDGIELVFKHKIGFLNAYSELIKHIVNKDSELKIDTRTITTNFDKILESLPLVNFDEVINEVIETTDSDTTDTELEVPSIDITPSTPTLPPIVIKNNPNRSRLILDIYSLNSSSYRLNELFNELKLIPLKYNNSVAASIRIFLDLAVLNYLKSEGLIGHLCGHYPDNAGIKNINLSKRLEFIKTKVNGKSQDIINKVLNPKNELSLDVLNGYVHSENTHYLNNRYLNNFWDLLFPLFEELLDIKEN
ncbi:ParB N-terminal domain-containing protein [Mariniflexile litorale]|uniref:ParB N-terminal domain-containing protein n=1 Tax=Mariniflexile litorale TaxID=3045158 RepID=A0AAU7EIY3_9FLAO|nr:ParB N-terminal domain-containing protein [Mariniflexile sp. KMM 9835]MDQ8211176.1 ParB N-terminal domain-containing protein [Mariniflexile sp. KMM 9835]